MPMKLEACRRQVVPRPGWQQRPLLGSGAGYQAADVARDYGAVVHSYPVVSNVQLPLEREDGGTTAHFSPHALGLYGMTTERVSSKGWSYIHESVRKRAEVCVRVNGKAVDVVPATEEKYVVHLHRQRSVDGRKPVSTGRLAAFVGKKLGVKTARK